MHKFLFYLACSLLTLGAFGDPPQKISNGWRASKNEFPYQISLRLPQNQFLCSGAIITKQHILTAAHCLESRDLNDIVVVTGTNSLTYGGVSHTIKKGVIHEKYKGLPWDLALLYDIAILTLNSPLMNNDPSWKLIKLPSRDYGSGSSVVIAGWGQTTENYQFQQNYLQKIYTHIANLEDCQEYSPVLFYDTQICILPTNGKTTCPGDSGGPLVINGEIVGIASSYLNCGHSPSLFTKVYAFRDFIKKETTNDYKFIF